MTIKTISFHAATTGPKLLFIGAIHGNERCGTEAIHKIIEKFQSGELVLLKGSVTFVPVANPLAYAQNVRYVDENLNRIFRPTAKPRSREAGFANALCRIVDACDAMLDIHSITARGNPFIYLDFPTPRNRAFAKVLGPKLAVTGWTALYKKLGNKHRSYETTAYAAKQGKDCLLIECGQHKDPASPLVAHDAIINSLRHYGLIKGNTKKKAFTEIRMSAGFFREHKNDVFAKQWKHLDRVRKGDALFTKADGKTVKTPYDAFIIMPKATARVGEDWLYLGQN